MHLATCKPFEMDGGWFCDVEEETGEVVYTAGPCGNAEQARWTAIDWMKAFEARTTPPSTF